MKDISKKLEQSDTHLTGGMQTQPIKYTSVAGSGLSSLQQATSYVLSQASQWGFGKSRLNIKRYKLNNQTWRLTVVNPRTRKTILQADGHGDTVFANEDNLARMAETLMAQGLTIQTQFDE